MFKPSQIERILAQITKNMLLYIGVNLGDEALMDVDRALLTALGLKGVGLGGAFPRYYKMYMLGRLTQLIGEKNSIVLENKDFEEYLKRGQYEPLSSFERLQYQLARQATYGHLKNLDNRIRMEVEGDIVKTLSRVEYEAIIKEEIISGVVDRKGLGTIISDIGHRTGDWSKDIGRIVDTEMNNIFQKGRAVQIAESNKGKDPLVYKDVYEGACRHCIALYLTHGLGSKPRVFKLSVLVANGSNIGRKVEDWVATMGGVHPWCRCNLRHLPEFMVWDKERKVFVHAEEELKREEKKLGMAGIIKVTVGDKEFVV